MEPRADGPRPLAEAMRADRTLRGNRRISMAHVKAEMTGPLGPKFMMAV